MNVDRPGGFNYLPEAWRAYIADLKSVRSEALSRFVDVHRGWCNYCKVNVEWCDNSPKGGCTLRDYLHSPARVADGLPDRPVGWTDVEEALITTPESPAKEQPGEQNDDAAAMVKRLKMWTKVDLMISVEIQVGTAKGGYARNATGDIRL